MHKNLFRLFITTLLLSATILLSGCGESTQGNNVEQCTPLESTEDFSKQFNEHEAYIESSNVEESSVQNPKSNSPRFSYELVDINITYDGYNRIVDHSFILTDNETGRQWLYILAYGATGCTSETIELTN